MAEAQRLGAKGSVPLDDGAFGARFHGPLVHETVRAEQAARRRGTAATKTRGMVSGGGAKPWRQKGTGRARAGSNRSPVWTGGGTVFGPQPRSYTTKVNRKERRAALRSALSLHAERSSIAVIDPAAFSGPRTRQAGELLNDWGQTLPTLVVLGEQESNAALSFRNLRRVAVLTPENVGVADLLRCASVVLSPHALDALTARAKGEAPAPEVEADASAASPARGRRAPAGPRAGGRARAADVAEATQAVDDVADPSGAPAPGAVPDPAEQSD